MAKSNKPGMVRVPLQKVLDRALEEVGNDRESYPSIPASQLAVECGRAMWYGFRGATPRAFLGRILRRFDVGNATESMLVKQLAMAGFEVHHENPRARNDRKQYGARVLGSIIGCRVDGFIRGSDIHGELDLGDEWHLLETKDMVSGRYHYDPDDTSYATPLGNRHPTDHPTKFGNPADITGRWWKVHKKGALRESRSHYGQVQAYMGMSRELHPNGKPNWEMWGLDAPLSKALYVAHNSDTSQLHGELIEYDPNAWLAMIGRAEKVVRAKLPPKRFKETPLYPPCSFCDHRPTCHGREPMHANCRTCEHSEVRMPGDRGFFGKRAQWFCNKHRQGCGDFTACDDWSPLLDPLEF